MANEEVIHDLKKDTIKAISALATEYQRLVEDAMIDKENALSAAGQKLKIDVHTMVIDQNVRNLLMNIRQIKEMKVSDNSQEQRECRAAFEKDCEEATSRVRSVVSEAYQQLSELADEGFRIRQAASKLLR